jgi:hypothetical protein
MKTRYTLIEYIPSDKRANDPRSRLFGYPGNGAHRIYVAYDVTSRELDRQWCEILEDNVRERDLPEDAVVVEVLPEECLAHSVEDDREWDDPMMGGVDRLDTFLGGD